MKPFRFQTERTDQGEQSLVPGVRPVTLRDRLQVLADAPLTGRRRQKPCNIGLFDDDASAARSIMIQEAKTYTKNILIKRTISRISRIIIL